VPSGIYSSRMGRVSIVHMLLELGQVPDRAALNFPRYWLRPTQISLDITSKYSSPLEFELHPPEPIMNEQEYNKFISEPRGPRLLPSVSELSDLTPRTLIFGYDTDSKSFHVYLGVDRLIHVVRYTSRAIGYDTGLILFHSHGESGGVTKPSDFVPNKRVYPESCDLEFCKLLRTYGVSVPFTKYTEGADEQRRNKFGSYAGLLYDPELEGLNLNAAISALPEYNSLRESYPVDTVRVATQAARETNVAYCSIMDLVTFVAASGADVVINRVREILGELGSRNRLGLLPERDPLFTAASLVDEIFSSGYSAYGMIDRVEQIAGTLIITIKEAGDEVFREGSDRQLYTMSPGSEFWTSGVSGTFMHRPFFGVRTKDGAVEVFYSEFGDLDTFVSKFVDRFKLIPLESAAEA
jgi:hypothetical protein